jgi:hypothetical protein
MTVSQLVEQQLGSRKVKGEVTEIKTVTIKKSSQTILYLQDPPHTDARCRHCFRILSVGESTWLLKSFQQRNHRGGCLLQGNACFQFDLLLTSTHRWGEWEFLVPELERSA